MREKFLRFMRGRYGVDSLSRFLLGAAVVSMVLSMVFSWRIINYLGFFMIFYGYFRMFSKNYARRSAENAVYLRYADQFWSVIHRQKSVLDQKKNYHIYKCPDCKQKIRIPRGKGRIEISCPKCNKKFVKKS